MLLLAACGDDGGGSDDPGSADAGAGATPSGGGGGGGSLTIGDETMKLDSARCFLEEQEAAGQTIELTGQASGTNSAGDQVTIDFTRYAASSDFAGDDISVTVGDPFSDESENLGARLDSGAVTLDGKTLSASSFEFKLDDGVTTTPGSFEMDC